MSVRVNKSSFNIREKLSELGRKFGLKGSELVAAETAQEARDLVSAGRKNLVINGDMRISQRVGTTSTNIAQGGYLLDRFRGNYWNGGSMTSQQVTDAPPGFHNSMKLTVTSTDTSIASGDYRYFRQIIEGNNINHLNWGSSNAKTVTLSFWVRSSIIGTHAGSVWNDGFNRSFPFDYLINFADTWEHKSITVPGCPDGTWETGLSRGINVAFVQVCGSSYTGTPHQWNNAGDMGPTNHVNLLATNGATWYITGIQLEVGKNATDFEHRQYGEELALCQRYYYLHVFVEGSNQKSIANAAAYSSGAAFGVVHFPTTMRAIPTLEVANVANAYRIFINGSSQLFNSFSTQEASENAFTLERGSLSLTQGHAGWFRMNDEPGARIAFSAEL
tara:strand:- start:15120 stop:16286 length:1167 start_codon:yes stop_codon:yes gene_type:complete